ncbi:enoyl-CoA hydratase-related protein, partial [Siminovitchia fortis]|uniref:enoyl-CoA hydratase-related protein n=1 Tax=Siminovitchia fortis TaxID=254758 RepID=UPI0036F3A9E6
MRAHRRYLAQHNIPPFNLFHLQTLIPLIPNPLLPILAPYPIPPPHLLHLLCHFTIPAHNPVFPQTPPKLPTFHAPYRSPYLPPIIPHKKPNQISFLSPQYNPHQPLHIPFLNTLVPLHHLQHQTVKWSGQI